MTVPRRRRVPAWLALAVVLSAARATAQDAAITTREFVSQLEGFIGRIESAGSSSEELRRVSDDMRPGWRVEAGGRTYVIPAERLSRMLDAAGSKGPAQDPADPAGPAVHPADPKERVVDELRLLRLEVSLYETAPIADAGSARTHLDRILSAREFRGIHGPSVWARMWQRAREMFALLLTALVGESAIPTIGNLLVYVLIVLAVIALAVLTFRTLRRAAAGDAPVASALVPRKEWAEWLREAEAAAARAAYREALHATYWCAVSWLEARGAWRTDRTRTPREYPSLIPDTHPDRATLAALTRKFERVWYGNDDADAAAFTEAMASLRKFGCPPA
jgi:hypothetical protein